MASIENETAKRVVLLAYDIHHEFGPGLLESVYEGILEHELKAQGLRVRRQVSVPVVYKGIHMPDGFRLDLLVEERLIVEVKSQEFIAPVAYKVLLTYLRLADKRLGILLNFGESQTKNVARRIANGMPE